MIHPLKTLALADDDESIHHLLRAACSKHYHIVGQCKNGLEAVSLVKTQKPNVLLLDFHMPVMDGMEALRQIVALQTTAVVIMTADQDPALARQAMDLGACGYVSKPFELAQLFPMLETAWHHFQTAQALTHEVASLSESLETRKLVERAKGILIEQQGFTEEEAHKALQKLSQDQAISLKEVCRSLIQVKMLLGKSAQRKVV